MAGMFGPDDQQRERMTRAALMQQMGGPAPSGPAFQSEAQIRPQPLNFTTPAGSGDIFAGGGGAPGGGGVPRGPLAGSLPPGAGIGRPGSDILGMGEPPGASVRTQTPAAQAGLGNFANKLEGFDRGKLDSGHDSPKYQFGRTMSQFDPKGGITQEMLDALNALGLGTVSGKVGGDKIAIGGNVDPRFEGVTEFDIIRDLENGGGWQWGGLNGKAAGGGGSARKVAGGGMRSLSGTPMAAALGQPDILQRIMAEIDSLAGGKGSGLTREALLSQLGG